MGNVRRLQINISYYGNIYQYLYYILNYDTCSELIEYGITPCLLNIIEENIRKMENFSSL